MPKAYKLPGQGRITDKALESIKETLTVFQDNNGEHWIMTEDGQPILCSVYELALWKLLTEAREEIQGLRLAMEVKEYERQ